VLQLGFISHALSSYQLACDCLAKRHIFIDFAATFPMLDQGVEERSPNPIAWSIDGRLLGSNPIEFRDDESEGERDLIDQLRSRHDLEFECKCVIFGVQVGGPGLR
jgi:hypothetical protein